MTREEAILWLNEELRTWENECQSKHPIKEALYEACKALEREPCEDAVSRKSVITIIQNHWWNCRDIDKLVNELPPVTPQEPNTWSLDDAREDFMHDVYNELDFLPTNDEANRIIDSFDMVTKGIKQEPRWIPVSERLPEENRMFLVTLVDKEDGCVCLEVVWYSHVSGEWEEVPTGEKVIAWMPLPQPYKAESEGEG
jgi:hypothetical protein